MPGTQGDIEPGTIYRMDTQSLMLMFETPDQVE